MKKRWLQHIFDEIPNDADIERVTEQFVFYTLPKDQVRYSKPIFAIEKECWTKAEANACELDLANDAVHILEKENKELREKTKELEEITKEPYEQKTFSSKNWKINWGNIKI